MTILLALPLVAWGPAAVAELGPILITKPVDQPRFEMGDVPAAEYTGSSDTIEAETLQQAGSSLAEIAATQAGVQFRQSGGLGSFSSVTLRGSSADQVNVYLDGVLLNEAAGGGVNFSDIELLDAHQVDIYRGAVPVQLGDTAIGGAINITTLRASKKPLTRLLLGGGSFGSRRLSAAWRGPVNRLATDSVVATFSHRASDNDFPFVFDNGSPLNPADDQAQRRNNSQTQTTSGLFKSTHQNRFGELENVLQLFSREQGVADWLNAPGSDASFDTDSFQWRSSLRTLASNEAGWSSRWDASFNRKSELFDDRNGAIGVASQQIIDTDSSVLTLRGYREKVSSRGSLSITAKVRAETLETRDLLEFTPATRADRKRFDAALQSSRFYSQGQGVLSFALFAQGIFDDYKIATSDAASRDATRSDFDSRTLAPQIGLRHNFNDRWTLRANLASQQRAPSFYELFGSRGLFVGNDNLKPERATNFDIGFSWQSILGAVKPGKFRRDITLEATFFRGLRKDLIARVYNAQGVGRADNISKALINGVEFKSAIQLQRQLSLTLSLTAQDTENQSSIRGHTGKQLPGEAALAGGVAAVWRNDQWRLGYDFTLSRDRFYDSVNVLPAADQAVHSISVVRQFRHWRLMFELNNLSAQNYEDFNGFPKPGRAGFISVTYQPELH